MTGKSLDMKIDKLKILDASPFNKAKLIAIVGNGGITDEDDDIISKSDCVIRFNNFATRDKIRKTKDPNRCDVLFQTFDLHSSQAKPKHVVIGIPFPFHSERIYRLSEKWYPNSRWWMVNPYWNELMCKELQCNSEGMGYQHPFPSIGFTCLWHLHKLKIPNIYLCGFNFYFDWKTKLCQGHELGLRRYPLTWNHNYPREIEWILKNLINVNFSPSVQRILDYARTKIK